MKEASLAHATQLLEHAPVGILLLEGGAIRWFNQTLLTLLDLKPVQLTGKDSLSLGSELRGVLIDPPELFMLQRDDQRWLRCQRQPMENGAAHFYIDVTEAQRLRLERDKLAENLQELTTRDPLTGLPNLRALMQGLEPLIARSRRYNNPLSLIHLGITLTGGDQTGILAQQDNACLRVGQLLKDQMRWADIIGRLDGSEFLLILPETSEEAARQLAEKLGNMVAALALTDAEGHTLHLQPYLGVAGYAKGDDSKRLLLRAADNAAAARSHNARLAAVN